MPEKSSGRLHECPGKPNRFYGPTDVVHAKNGCTGHGGESGQNSGRLIPFVDLQIQ